MASPNPSHDKDLKNLNPNFGQDLARLNSTLGKLKIGWKRTRTTFLKRNVTSNKNKKKTKCDVDYMKTKWKLNKAFDNLLCLNCCVGKGRLSKSYRVGNLRQKRYKEKIISINNHFCLDQPKRSICFLTDLT